MNEVSDNRVLGAIRLCDLTTGRAINYSLVLESKGVVFFQNLSGLYVIKSAPEFSEYCGAFDELPSTPAIGSERIDILASDPAGHYLPRKFSMNLPRDPSPEPDSLDHSLFNPVEVYMFPGPAASALINWSIIRVTVTMEGPGDESQKPVAGALLRVFKNSDTASLAKGITDKRGEGVVFVPGIPVTTFAETEDTEESESEGTGPVMVFEVSARLEVTYNSEASWPLDPDLLEVDSADFLRKTINVTLRTGMERHEDVILETD